MARTDEPAASFWRHEHDKVFLQLKRCRKAFAQVDDQLTALTRSTEATTAVHALSVFPDGTISDPVAAAPRPERETLTPDQVEAAYGDAVATGFRGEAFIVELTGRLNALEGGER